MRFKNIYIIAILLSLTFSNNIFANQQNEFAKPKTEQLVVDNANEFSKTEFAALTTKLNHISSETSTQILVYTTTDLMGYAPGDYAQRLGEEWGVGGGKFDNGIVILFKPKTNNSKGEVWISVGYGIEALIPDATANQIVNNEMIPLFKQNNIYGGINNAIDICYSLTKGEFTAEEYKQQASGSAAGAIIFIIFMILFFVISGRSRKARYGSMGSRSNMGLLAALFLMGSGSHRGSGFSNFSSGSGSFGGGGGFGGFGGGSFGGGGAGGSW